VTGIPAPIQPPAGSPLLRVRAAYKRFGPVVALDGFDLEVRAGELLALLGPSGCGKTTALRGIAGLERLDRGEVWLGDRCLTGAGAWVPPERRRIGMVFQDWALFPHLDVGRNLAFGLAGRAASGERVGEVLALVGLEAKEHHMPHELSGGQQQRVALARALAPAPDVILLDEPFSNLDAALRARVRGEVRGVLRRAGATSIFVTHDQEEALAVADRVAVMAAGRVLQVGRPEQVYGSPASAEVAGLLGEANFLLGQARGGRVDTVIGPIPAGDVRDGQVRVMVRPESIRLEPAPDGQARVAETEFYGHDRKVVVELPGGDTVAVRQFAPLSVLDVGDSVRVRLVGPASVFSA
jgi:iron(III) transport system ATP-binding protein